MNADKQGNKIAEKQPSKQQVSARFRLIRKDKADAGVGNSKFCGECGYHVRSVNHVLGRHHSR